MADENENVVKSRFAVWVHPNNYNDMLKLISEFEKLVAMPLEEKDMWIDDMIAYNEEAQELIGEPRERPESFAQVAAEPEPQPANNDGREFCFDSSCGGRVKLVPGILSTFGVCTRCGR